MKIIADLHLHSKYSRATSKDLNLENLEKYAKIKGVNLLGTGDFTHPKWIEELKLNLTEDGSGILSSKSGFNFLLSVELSNVFSQDGKLRKVHNIILAPSFDVVGQINEALSRKGRLDYDGRPIFGFSCIELVEILKEISSDIEIIPAHAWTPWFSIFGSMSGFDSLKDCFKEKEKHIYAIETGLSSDPEMNWRLSSLDNISLVSFSDAHSFWPWRIGREATIFNNKLTYKEIIRCIRNSDIDMTLEMWPHEGKYHYSGHRNCNVCLSPEQSIKVNNFCPKCLNMVTIGVLQRVNMLADREEGFIPKKPRPFTKLIPLSELISLALNTSVSSSKVWAEYNKLIKYFGNEINILLNVQEVELRKITNNRIADFIIKNREQKIKFQPGFDGVYGKPIIESGYGNVDFSENISIDNLKKNNQVGLKKFF